MCTICVTPLCLFVYLLHANPANLFTPCCVFSFVFSVPHLFQVERNGGASPREDTLSVDSTGSDEIFGGRKYETPGSYRLDYTAKTWPR